MPRKKTRNKKRRATGDQVQTRIRYRERLKDSGQSIVAESAKDDRYETLSRRADDRSLETARLKAVLQAMKMEQSRFDSGEYSCKFPASTATALGAGKTMTNGLRPVGPGQTFRIIETPVNVAYDRLRLQSRLQSLNAEFRKTRQSLATPSREPATPAPAGPPAQSHDHSRSSAAQSATEHTRQLLRKIREFQQSHRTRFPVRDRSRFDEANYPMRGL